MKGIILGILLLVGMPSVALAEKQSGVVKGYIPYSSGGKEILIFNTTNSVAIGCNATARFAIDNTSLRYKATLSVVIAAFHSQKEIVVDYLPSCNVWGNAADIRYICIGEIAC